MLHYRFYKLDSDAHIISALDRECADDVEALRSARALLEDCPAVEVWQGARKVQIVPKAAPRA